MKVRIDADELYPFYSVSADDMPESYDVGTIEMTDKELYAWQDAVDTFKNWQKIIENKLKIANTQD